MDTLTSRTAVAVTAAIEAAGETQLSVSDATGIPRATLIRRLKGHTSFTVAELELIAEFLGTTVTALLGAAAEPASVQVQVPA